MIFLSQTTLRLQQFHTLNLVTPINLHLATFTTTITPRLFWLLFLHTVRNRGLLFALDLNISRLSSTCISHCSIDLPYLRFCLCNLIIILYPVCGKSFMQRPVFTRASTSGQVHENIDVHMVSFSSVYEYYVLFNFLV